MRSCIGRRASGQRGTSASMVLPSGSTFLLTPGRAIPGQRGTSGLTSVPDGAQSVLPEALESARGQFGIPNGVQDLLVTEVVLDCTGIVAVVGQLEPTAMA